MRNTFKKVLFSLWAIGLVWAGSLGMVNAQINPDWWQDTQYNPGWHTTLREDSLLRTIKSFVNRILWLLSLIALVICLWWWFQMLTASWDENKYKKWFTILKQAWLWLAIIWLSWLFVSIVFRLINKFTTEGA